MKKLLLFLTMSYCSYNCFSQAGNLNTFFNGTGIKKIDFFPSNSLSEEGIKTFRQADGKLLVVFSIPGLDLGSDRARIRRFLSNGNPDPSYCFGGYSEELLFNVNDAAIQADGKIVVVGSSWNGTNSDFAAARYNVDGHLDHTFNADGILVTDFTADEGAAAVAVQSDGKIVVVGSISSASGTDFAIARYTAAGNLDPTFSGDGKKITGFTTNSDVPSSIAIQPDGKIVVVGITMTTELAIGDFAIARYLPNGSLDPAFSADGKQTTDFGLDEGAKSVAVQSDGKIVVGGEQLVHDSDDSFFALARYNSNGTLDNTFSGDGKQISGVPGMAWPAGKVITIKSDGKILFAGSAWGEDGDDFVIAQYLPNGNLDISFNSDGFAVADFAGRYDYPKSILLQSDGKILLTGVSYDEDNGDIAVARMTSTGTLDATFSGDGELLSFFPIAQLSHFSATATQPDGKIIAVGSGNNGYNSDFVVARFLPNGTLDASFSFDGIFQRDIRYSHDDDEATAVAIQPDGKILVAGYAYDRATNKSKFALIRLTTEGYEDISFNGSLDVITDFPMHDARAQAIVVHRDGKIIVAGTAYNGINDDFAVARYNSDGSLDGTFSGDGLATVDFGHRESGLAVAVQFNGRIIVGGQSWNDDEYSSTFALARFSTNGTLDLSYNGDGKQTTTFAGWAWPTITAMALQGDGKLVVAGSAFGETSADFAVARYLVNGSLDPTFSTDGWTMTDIAGSSPEEANAIAIQPDGKIIVGGNSNGDAYATYALARYNSNGSLDPGFSLDGIQTTAISPEDNRINGLSIYQHTLYAAGQGDEGSKDMATIAAYQLGSFAMTLTCPANKSQLTEVGRCDAIVTGIDPVVSPTTGVFTVKYSMTGATTGSGTGSVSGKRFNRGTTTVTYKIAEDATKTCSFTVTISGRTEVCNGLDDDCDGLIDEGFILITFYRDADGDGYGNPAISIRRCTPPAGYVTNNRDCNDGNAAIHPGASEVKNGVDDNCNGIVDEIFSIVDTQKDSQEQDRSISGLSVNANPNPATDYFRVTINSSAKAPLTLRIINMTGSVMETRNNVSPNTELKIGSNYKPGLYILEAVQDKRKIIVKLIKQ